MKTKIFYYISVLCLIVGSVVVYTDVWGQGLYLGSDNTILNVDPDLALDIYDNNNPITDPLRQGAYKPINANNYNNPDQKLIGVVNPGLITDHDTAMNSTMQIIKNLINYALGLLSLIALIYLIYHGFLILTATGNDTQYKTGFKGLKFAVIALAGIGLSWLMISFIFWIIVSFS